MKLQKTGILCLVSLLLAVLGTGCNKEEGADDSALSGNTLVRSFSLGDKVNSSVPDSSCFFTIDPVSGYIFNADSLPYQSDVSSLVANISFRSVSAVEIAYVKQNETEPTVVDYLSNSTDSLDFSGKSWTDTDKKASVKMTVTALNGDRQIYYIDVRVHQIASDSLRWRELTATDLPAAIGAPTVQKTVGYDGAIYCFTGDGENYSLAVSETPSEISAWNKELITPGFAMNIGSLQAAPDCLYVLDEDGNLYRSTDGRSWSPVATDAPFVSLIGVWSHSRTAPETGRLLGVVKEGDTYRHDCYPRPENYTPKPIESGFPVSGYSNMTEIYDGGSYGVPQTAFVGGRLADGTLTADIWAYDGAADSWAVLGASSSVTPREGAMFFRYYSFFYNSTIGAYTQLTSFFVIGGADGNGPLKDIYISSNPGQNWNAVERTSVLALPADFPAVSFASVIVFEESNTLAAMLPAGWKRVSLAAVPSYMSAADGLTDGPVPYIYMFGGYNAEGLLQKQIWRGIIDQLTFAPIP